MDTYANADIFTMKNLLDPAESTAMDDGFLVSTIRLTAPKEFGPVKFDGSLFLICCDGAFTANLNGREIEVKASRLIPTSPETAISSIRPAGTDADILVIAISKSYFFDLKLDLGEVLSHMRFDKLKTGPVKPYLQLTEDELRIVRGHCSLIQSIYNSSLQQKKDYYTLLLTSAMYILNRAVQAKLKETSPIRHTSVTSRSRTAFADFMNLAVEYYDKERSIKFYADKMCLTPKYLSKLIKEGCGSSASEIIDNLVIAKAKSMLKHSDLSVKVIAAKLNFSNQSSFNKFFKAKTGLPPLKFREK